ncbi:acyl-coenzyme A synthetases/AMP-(fatty) acid ligase, partial [Paenibacillus popilliae ATCC 14706]
NYFVTESEIWTHNNGPLIKLISKMLGNAGKNAARNTGKSTAKNAKNVTRGTGNVGKSFVKLKRPKELDFTYRRLDEKVRTMMNKQGNVKGGSFKEVNASKGQNEVGHHIAQNAYNKRNGISRNDGPAVLMSKYDHSMTRTFAGKGKASMRADDALGLNDGNVWLKMFGM